MPEAASTVFRSPEGARTVQDAYDETVRALLPDVEHVRIDLPSSTSGPGMTVHALAAGPLGAPPVVLLHGSGATAAGWAAELTGLSADHRVLALDLPGEPGDPSGTRLPLRPGVHASWLGAVLHELGVERPILVGESLGGWVALDAASAAPSLPRAVVLVSSSGIGPRRTAPLLVAGLLAVAGRSGRARALSYLTGPHSTSGATGPNPLATLALTTFAHFAPRTDPLPVFDDAALSAIDAPVWALYGARDRMLDAPAAAHRAGTALPDAHVELIGGAGHLLPARASRVERAVRDAEAGSGRH